MDKETFETVIAIKDRAQQAVKRLKADIGQKATPDNYYLNGYIAGLTAASDLFSVVFDSLEELQKRDAHFHEVIERRIQDHDRN